MAQLLPYFQEGVLEAGCDEAGRGCLAGPVFAAAVILPPDFHHPLLNDSKKMSEKDRHALRPIIEKEAIAWAVAQLDAPEIDKINILKASIAAMHKAVLQLRPQPEFLLIDGNRFYPFPGIAHKTIVQGDSLYASISAASVLAKTYRDDYMLSIANLHPEYHWHSNKGYPTEEHREALRRFGITPFHRRTYRLLPDGEQLTMF